MSVEVGQLYKPRWYAHAFYDALPGLLKVVEIDVDVIGQPVQARLTDADGTETRRGFIADINRTGGIKGFRPVPGRTPEQPKGSNRA